MLNEKAETEKIGSDLTQIPMTALVQLGAVFVEGEKKYGRENWQRGLYDMEYQLERANHALLHLLRHIDAMKAGRTQQIDSDVELNLAKVMWFCATQIELERMETLVQNAKERH